MKKPGVGWREDDIPLRKTLRSRGRQHSSKKESRGQRSTWAHGRDITCWVELLIEVVFCRVVCMRCGLAEVDRCVLCSS